MTDPVIGVVGGGIVGLAVARELAGRRPGTTIEVLEKESGVGQHQTGHSSGVVHAGVYYAPGSLKANLCTRGRALLREYCADRGLPYVECGKLVVALEAGELARLDQLVRTATANGVPGIERLDGPQIGQVEPHAVGLAALHSPRTAVTDFVAIAEAYADDVRAAGGSVLLSTEVTGIRRGAGSVSLLTTLGERRYDRLVVCAGLHSDRLGRLADGRDGPRIVPFRGAYLRVLPPKHELVRGLVYPVPDPRYPFLGVHLTRRVTGELEVGPNAVLALAREGYRHRDVSLRDLRSLATWPGFWRMAGRHWGAGVRELRGSLSLATYVRQAARYVPGIGPADVVRAGAGVRAQAVDRDGTLVDDFRIGGDDLVTTVRNAPSPAATSSLAIAELVVERMGLR